MSLLMTVMFMLFYVYLFAKGSETQRLTLTATGIRKDQTITLTCNIHEGMARSVGWNQGRKVISIGYVNDSCETSPPEPPFSAKCLCLNITVYTCTLTVDPSMHIGDEWECSFADNGLSIKSNGVRIQRSIHSRTETGQEMCTIEVNKGAVVIKMSSNITKDILNIDVDRDYVGDCDKSFEQAVILPEYKTQYNISLTRSGQCIFTILNYNLTKVTVSISSQAKALTTVLINGKSHQRCKDPWKRSFNLKSKEGHKQKDENNWSIRGWIGVLIGVLLFGIAIENAIVYFIWKNCYKSQRVTANGTPHDGESHDERQGEDQRLTVENGEIQQNGGTPGNRKEEIGRRSSIVEYLRNCFSSTSEP